MTTSLFEDFAYKYFFDNYEEFGVEKDLFWQDFVDRFNQQAGNSLLKFQHFLTIPADYSLYLHLEPQAANPIVLFNILEDILIEMIFTDGVEDRLDFAVKAYSLLVMVKQFCFLVFNDSELNSHVFYQELFGDMYKAHQTRVE